MKHFISLAGLKKPVYVTELNKLRGELKLPTPKLSFKQLGVKMGSTFATTPAQELHEKFASVYRKSLSAPERKYFVPESAEVTYAVFVECLAAMMVFLNQLETLGHP
jgi:hypothetical protein